MCLFMYFLAFMHRR